VPPDQLYQRIVDAPFDDKLFATSIDLGIVVLLLVNPKDKMIDRVALSNTDLARGAVKVSAKPFSDIRIPVHHKENAIARAIASNEHQLTEDWQSLFVPALTAEQARRNQAGASIESSLVWPLKLRTGGALIFSFYQPSAYIDDDHLTFAEDYAQLVSQQLAQAPLEP